MQPNLKSFKSCRNGKRKRNKVYKIIEVENKGVFFGKPDKFDEKTKIKEINQYKRLQQNSDSSYKYRMNSAGYGEYPGWQQ